MNSESDVRRILRDCAAVRAMIGRIERSLSNLTSKDGLRIAGLAAGRPQDAFEQSDNIKSLPSSKNAPEAKNRAFGAISSKPRQTEFFQQSDVHCDNTQKTTGKRHKRAKKGCPTLTRKECLDNLRRIAGGRELLFIGDVNEVFGYSRTTSGTFVRHAWKRGDLVGFPCRGNEILFPVGDVRSFICSHYGGVKDMVGGVS